MAKRLGKKWLLLLDQDTEFPADALEQYSSAMSTNKTAVLLAPILTCEGKIYSPCGHVAHVGFPLKRVTPGVRSATWKSLLNSGMCVNVDAFEKVGGFDERIALDFADHDFIRRYKKHFDSFVVIDVVCRHSFSDNESCEIERSLARFSCYCRGARTYARGVWDAFSVLPIVFLRALRLSMRYRSLRYLRLFFHTSAKHSP
jgi:GT2 family glycosyltransferase